MSFFDLGKTAFGTLELVLHADRPAAVSVPAALMMCAKSVP